MVGWHLLLLLLAEMSLYGSVARHVHNEHGWSVGGALALAISIYVSVRIVLIAAEFVLARWQGPAIPDVLRVSPLQLTVMYLRELGGWLLMFGSVMPFVLARRSVVDRPRIDTATLPLLLVHGLACNRGNWFWFRRQLERRGYTVYTVDYTPPFARIANYVSPLARAIDEVLEATSAQQLILIGHSMGGLVSRAYLDRFGFDKVAHVITMGTPHLGTWMARLGVGPNVHDMTIDSPWLAALHEREAARSADPYSRFSCIFTYHDNLVTPQTNATLPGAVRIPLSGIGHLSLVLSSRVVNAVLRVVAQVQQGTDCGRACPKSHWIPAFAGMTG
ncbi:MAG: alpha/beta fold hydrolase [Betaproteobacteria bacterium]